MLVRRNQQVEGVNAEAKRSDVEFTTLNNSLVTGEQTQLIPSQQPMDLSTTAALSYPSAPLESKVPYLESTADTFEEISPNEWIHAADGANSFLNWADENENDWIRQPNATTVEELLQAVNKRVRETGPARSIKVGLNAVATGLVSLGYAPYAKTRNVKPGEIHFSDNAGVQEIHVGSGYEYITSTQHTWGNIRKTDEKFIKEGMITIVNILPGTIGVAADNNKPIILLPGRHAYNSQNFIMNEKSVYDIKTDVIASNPISIIRVQPHELGLAYVNGVPMILKPGLHVKHDPAFLFLNKLNTRTLKLANEAANVAARNCYEHGTISIIRVDKGFIGCAFDGSKPVFLQNGIHIKNTQSFKFEKTVNAKEQYINFNTLHLVRVNQGQLGYAWHNNIAIELPAGLHEFDDAQFIFGKIFSLNESLIQFGNITHIIVNAGEARAIWEEGKLKILNAGRYSSHSPLLSVAPNTIPLQDIIKPLHKIKVTTQDRVPMLVTGQVTYRVSNPEELVTGIGQGKLEEAIERCTDVILREQISQTDLTMISPDQHADEEGNRNDKSRKLFGDKSKVEGDNYRGRLCTIIQKKLSDDTKKWGIQIVEFAISEIGFENVELEKALAEATANTRKAETELHLQQAKNITTTSRIEAESKQKTIQQKNSASVLEIDTQAKNAALIASAEAQANADVSSQKIAADAALYVAQKESEAAMLRVKVTIAETEARLLLLNNPSYIELEKLRLQLQISQNLTNMPTPAVVFNGDGAKNAANHMFLGDGVSLMDFAMKQKGNLFGRGRNQISTQPAVDVQQQLRRNSVS